ncbi:MAG: hypothetical protein JWR69_2117 [Pedosphaera sp.]|nr:hypothetical protein [Pedosphaera sp.]
MRIKIIFQLSFLVTQTLPLAAHALEPFPLQATVSQVQATLATNHVETTGLHRDDYLAVATGIVDYFHHFQTNDGRIIDPFLRKEIQYSTPSYAWAATALVIGGKQTNLLESAALALESSLQQLAEGKANENHGDFFIFPSMLAYENLRDRVTPARRKHWEDLLRAIKPDVAYRDVLGGTRTNLNNWNIAALSGEFLRHQAGFTDLNFVEESLAAQLPHFTTNGMYRDPNVPMAYDHFPRHFLAFVSQRGYAGKYRDTLEALLERAAWTSLLIQSPCGELPTGGRSAQHQWNEAMQCVTYEVWAARKQHANDPVAAHAFKRAARLALQSVQRWVRPSGELWIVKNKFDPAVRHGFQTYSSHSQHNLLAASMLATAWLSADDAIPEGPSPADVGGFVVNLPEFHKVIANAGGLYVELDTKADPEYNSTGLIRVHKTGVDPLVGPTDGGAIQTQSLAAGVAWREGERWQSLSALGQRQIRAVVFSSLEAKPSVVRFNVYYELQRPGVVGVSETYELTPDQVRVTAELLGTTKELRVRFPALAFAGQHASKITLAGSKATVGHDRSTETFTVESPANTELQRSGEWIYSRNGYLEEIRGDVKEPRVTYTLQPRYEEKPAAH